MPRRYDRRAHAAAARQDNLRKLKEEWQAKVLANIRRWQEQRAADIEIWHNLNDQQVAMVDAIQGNPSRLLEYLGSERPLTNRREVASCLALAFKKPNPRTGRPRKGDVQLFASQALIFYEEWKQLNRRLGIRNYGHANDMKEEACRVILDLYAWQKEVLRPFPTPRAVRELMDRPKTRR
jgi:hypothetical protein